MDVFLMPVWAVLIYLFGGAIGILATYKLFKMAKRMHKGALFLLALLPLISIFPIPPVSYKNLDKSNVEQVEKSAEDDSDPK